MPRRLKKFLAVSALAVVPLQAFAQTSGSASTQSTSTSGAAREETTVTTPTGHEVNIDVGGYRYVEPGMTSISIHGLKFGGEYTGTRSLNSGRRWFLQADVRGLGGSTTYDGWCAPFLIRPDRTSPNGYMLGIGEFSPCSESGDRDWYVEARALVGKDFVGNRWGWSPNAGLGVRHLSNGIGGVGGYRTEDYLYLPVGITARTIVASNHALTLRLEYDHLLHGWQTTRDSKRGGGDVPATPTAPPFTIQGFSDISFDQHLGGAIRGSARYQLTRKWSVEPEYIHWRVSASRVNYETATFTVNGITARQQLGAYEPLNWTNELVVKVGVRF